MSPWI
jgi:serine/threonine protein kinase